MISRYLEEYYIGRIYLRHFQIIFSQVHRQFYVPYPFSLLMGQFDLEKIS